MISPVTTFSPLRFSHKRRFGPVAPNISFSSYLCKPYMPTTQSCRARADIQKKISPVEAETLYIRISWSNDFLHFSLTKSIMSLVSN
jgi:hypothetical protein